MELSEAQVRFFHTFGYLQFPQVFTPEEMAWVTEEFEAAIQAHGGREHDGTRRTMFGAPCEWSPRMCGLLDDPRILGLLGGILGEDFNYAGGDGNYYTGDTGWHPDGNWGQLWACKLAFYLDPVARDTGCLRVMPGSHLPSHFVRADKIDLNKSQERFGVAPRDIPGNVALESNPGDLALFNHDLYHAAFGGGARRRMFTMNLTRHAHTENDRELLHTYLSHHSPGAYKSDMGMGMYTRTMVESADENRTRHLFQCRQMHDEMFPRP